MTNASSIVDRYRAFAEQQAAGVSPTFYSWAIATAEDTKILDLLDQLPQRKQQPNLVFAAARVHGAHPGDPASLHHTITKNWPDVRATILERSTQTNEAARCAALLLGLQHIDGPIALIEVGAAAGLCLIPDRYSYTFNDGKRLDPADGPSPLSMRISLGDGLGAPARMPDIVWRAGLDLNPLDPADPADLAWLEALIWPEHDERRHRLSAAAAITAAAGPRVRRGDLFTDLTALAEEAPPSATLVVFHAATLAYLTAPQRHQATQITANIPARRIGFEGRGIDPTVGRLNAPITPATLFVAALDGRPYALADGHSSHLHPV